MKKQIEFFFLLLTICPGFLFAQNVQITGKVTDVSGAPIVGVTIYQEDKTSNGTTSDTRGIYHISVPEKAALVFSYLGYQTQTIRLSGKSVVNVTLEEDKLALDAVEIVSVGYGSVARRDLTGSVGKVEMDELVKTTNSNFDQAIAGKIAGVVVSSGDGQIGAEASITPIGVAGFTALTALNTTDDPLRASIPFDKDRNGFIMGEGSGVVVLESLDHALARGAKIYAELAGYGATSDAFHITSPAEDGSGAAKAMEFAIQDAGMKPEDVDYINAHGTGTHHNDLFETLAIKAAFGEHAHKVRINSTKSMIGHLLGAAGGVEFITCVKSIEDGFVHATAGLVNQDEECDLDYTKGEGVPMEINCAISNSLGFGGHNATLLVKKYRE